MDTPFLYESWFLYIGCLFISFSSDFIRKLISLNDLAISYSIFPAFGMNISLTVSHGLGTYSNTMSISIYLVILFCMVWNVLCSFYGAIWTYLFSEVSIRFCDGYLPWDLSSVAISWKVGIGEKFYWLSLDFVPGCLSTVLDRNSFLSSEDLFAGYSLVGILFLHRTS